LQGFGWFGYGFRSRVEMPGFIDNESERRRNRRVPVRGQTQTTRKITSETESSSDFDDSNDDDIDVQDETAVDATADALLQLRLYPKHPLKHSWTFWCLDVGRSSNWEECLVPLNTFRYVEDFWALFHHLATINEISCGADYMMFKEGIQPKWEDARNRSGGRWMIKLEPQNRAEEINHQAWIELLLLLIGDGIEGDNGKVTGAVCNVRRMCDKLSLWMADCGDESSVVCAGEAFQAALQHWQFRQPFRFERHVDVETKTGSQAKALYTLPSSSRPRHI